ncbi:hypothetical protein FQN51_007703 [Onygenales sp. PD_10]|nr:hypothetical protein FQN51_007703 [Onygenales sp. PD_10]
MDPPPPQSIRKRLQSYLKDKINKSKRGADFPAMPSDEIDHYDPGHKCDRRGIPEDSPFTTMGVYGETHGERVRYLQDLKDAQLLCPKHYPNLDAAIEHHKQFPANEEYPDMLVHFQHGKVVEKKDLDARYPLWLEGRFSICSSQPTSSQPPASTPPATDLPSHPTTLQQVPANSPERKKATSAIYGWNTIRQVRVPTYGTGATYSTVMYYDTGSNTLSLNFADRAMLGISVNDTLPVVMNTVAKREWVRYIEGQIRVLTEKHEVLVPWSDEHLVFVGGGPAHLSNHLLQDNNFVCSTPDKLMFVAKSRVRLAAMVI